MWLFPFLLFIVVIAVVIVTVTVFWEHLSVTKGQIFERHFQWSWNAQLRISLLLGRSCVLCVPGGPGWGGRGQRRASPESGREGKRGQEPSIRIACRAFETPLVTSLI